MQLHSVRKAEEARTWRSSPNPHPNPNLHPGLNPTPYPQLPNPQPKPKPKPNLSLTLARRARSGGAAHGSTCSARARRPRRCCRPPASQRAPAPRGAPAAVWVCSRPTGRGCSGGSRPIRRSSTSRPSPGCSSAGGAGDYWILFIPRGILCQLCPRGKFIIFRDCCPPTVALLTHVSQPISLVHTGTACNPDVSKARRRLWGVGSRAV